MSEQINPIVSEKDMGADGKLRKWSTGRKVKWIICIVVILAVALGFWHQHYMRSDSQIKAVFNDNKANFQTTAEFMIESISCEKPTLPKGKCSIKSLTENNACKSVKKELEELERRNVTYIDSDGLTVKFYTIYDHYYIYRSPISSSGGEDNLGDGWSYVKQVKADFFMDEKFFFVHFFMQSNGLYIRVIDERLFKTTKEVTALTRDIDYIVDKFSDDIYRAALAVTGSVHEAEDIVSEVIIKYFTRQGELFFNDDEHLKAWLLRTAINLSKDLLRSAGRRLRAENEVSASSDFSSPDMQIDVQNAINRLDKKYRIVLYLYYYQGYKTEEIADILGTGKGTVTSRLKRARGKLRLSLSDYDEKEMSV